jgi:hypothetical protein
VVSFPGDKVAGLCVKLTTSSDVDIMIGGALPNSPMPVYELIN